MNETDEGAAKGEEHLLTIGVASRMTSVHEATLRVWERRYGFPQPARTAGAHRLYSRQEIVRLGWVKARIEEGMQVSKAIGALRRLEHEEGPLSEVSVSQSQMTMNQRPDDASLPALHRRLVEAMLAHNSQDVTEPLESGLHALSVGKAHQRRDQARIIRHR